MAPEESDQLGVVPAASTSDPASTMDKPLSGKPLGYFLAILAGFFTAGPLGVVVSPLALLTIAKSQKWDSEKKPNRFLTWALVGIIGAPVCGAVTFFGGAALITAFAPKGLESVEGLSPDGESSVDELLPTMATIHLKNDTNYAIEHLLLSVPDSEDPFTPQISKADAHQSIDVLVGNGTMDALPCTMDATVQYADGEKKDLGSFDFCANAQQTLVIRYPEGSDFE